MSWVAGCLFIRDYRGMSKHSSLEIYFYLFIYLSIFLCGFTRVLACVYCLFSPLPMSVCIYTCVCVLYIGRNGISIGNINLMSYISHNFLSNEVLNIGNSTDMGLALLLTWGPSRVCRHRLGPVDTSLGLEYSPPVPMTFHGVSIGS